MLQDILKILEKDARTSNKQIATITGRPEEEIAAEIKKADHDQIILKYKAIVNWDKIENEHVFALIEVKIAPQRDVGFDSIAERDLSLSASPYRLFGFRHLRPFGHRDG